MVQNLSSAAVVIGALRVNFVCWVICCHLMTFFKISFLKNSFGNTLQVSNALDPYQDHYSVSPDKGPNCLQRPKIFNLKKVSRPQQNHENYTACLDVEYIAKVYSDFEENNFMIIWTSSRENLSSGYANNKGADQPAHPRSLVSTFAIRFLESTISKLATSEISIFQLVPVAEQAGF